MKQSLPSSYAQLFRFAKNVAAPTARGPNFWGDIIGDLRALVSGAIPGRRNDEEITIFKSAGMAVEDYAAMRLILPNSAKASD